MTVVCARFDLPTPTAFQPLEVLLQEWGIARVRRLALFAKVEGDYADDTRQQARAAIAKILGASGLEARSALVTVIGSEGVSTPFGFVIADLDGDAGGNEARLALGFGKAASPDEALLDDASLVDAVAEVARAAMNEAGLAPEQVAMLLVNVPPVTSGDLALRGRRARALAAFGAGVALGEPAVVDVLDDLERYVARTQTYTGPGILGLEVIAIGNRPGAGGDLVAVAAIAADLLDVRAFKKALMGAGLVLDTEGELAEPERVAVAVVKSGARADGIVRGARTVIREKGIPPEKHVRAVQTGILGSLLQTTRVFNTFDPVHQAPDGGSTVCFVVRVPNG